MTERPDGLCRIGGPPGCGMGNSTTVSVAVSMRDTESWSGLTTHTVEPSAVIWIGPLLNERAPAASATPLTCANPRRAAKVIALKERPLRAYKSASVDPNVYAEGGRIASTKRSHGRSVRPRGRRKPAKL